MNSPDAGSVNDSSETKLRPGVLLRNEDQELGKKFDETMALIKKSGVLEEVLKEIGKESS